MKGELKKPVIFVFSTAYLPFIGGAEVAIEQVAKRFKDMFDFVIFTSRMRGDLPTMEVRSEGLVIRVGFGNKFDKFLLLFFGWFRALRELKKRRGRMIFWVMDFSFGAAVAGFLKIFYPKIPLVFTIQYGYGEERVARGRFGLMNLAFRLILMQADYVTAISNYLLDLCKQYGYIGEEAVIHNGVDLKKFTNQESRLENRVIISTSRRVYKNGLDILEKAFEIVKKKFPDAELKIISDIPYDELPKYLWKAHIFVRPSRSEGMGNAFVEALAAGLPIVGTPVGGILDIIKDGETGLFAKVDDPKDLAEKIKILLADKALARKIVENGRKMVEERFDWNKIAQNYSDIFNHELNLKKRVLIATGIFPPEAGGPATYSKILLDELPKKNFGARVLNFRSVRRWPKIIRHFIYGLKLMAYGRNADIIFAQDPVSVGLAAAIAAKILRKKFLLKIVGDYAWEQGVQRFGVKEVLDEFLKNKPPHQKFWCGGKYRWEVELLRKVQKFVANRAEKIVVPSEYLRKVVRQWGINHDNIHVVYNTFEWPTNLVKPGFRDYKSDKQDYLQNPIKFKNKKRVLLSAGRLVPWKGFSALIEILPQLLNDFPNLRLIIVGSGPEKDKLKSQVINQKLEKEAILTGSVPRQELLECLSSADVFALNTAYEGFSHLILEAMALGAPIVTTKVGGNPEIIKGENGFLVGFNDKEALYRKIYELLTNPFLAEKFSNNGCATVAQLANKEFMLNHTINIFKDL
ncbi:MAG: glycosyltransferase family 4 protein [Candidatus Giovannonibacteria bacterium]|nr:MAG: glycosyltransferase family 4 protein [Candidatus Giovannonibacteria bacterium]